MGLVPALQGRCLQVFSIRHLGETGELSWLSVLVIEAVDAVTRLRPEIPAGQIPGR